MAIRFQFGINANSWRVLERRGLKNKKLHDDQDGNHNEYSSVTQTDHFAR